MFALDFFDAMPHVAADYSDSAGTFALRVFLQESDRAFRTTARDQLLGSASTGVVISEPRIRRGGIIATTTARYRVDRVVPSSVPGLSDLKLERVEGAAALAFDASVVVPRDERVIIDGRTIAAHVNRSVEVEEIGADGTRAIVSRTSVAVLIQDAEGISLKSVVEIDGRRRAVARVLEDGIGFLKVLL